MIRIGFLIRSLLSGGAERQLSVLALALDRSQFDVRVYTFYRVGKYVDELEKNGIPVIDLKKEGLYDIGPFLMRFSRTIWRDKLDIVYSFLTEPNVLAALSTPMHRAKIIWGIRGSKPGNVGETLLGFIRSNIEVAMSMASIPARIVYNSTIGRQCYESTGFRHQLGVVIPNGFSHEQFKPNELGGQKLRAQWGITEDTPVIGIVGRLDPIKNHETFLRAAAQIHRSHPEVHFVCLGDGAPTYVEHLRRINNQLGLQNHVHWPGEMNDVCSAYSAFDVCCLTSDSEGFPNVLAEAMLCKIPCVSTHAGDAYEIIGDLRQIAKVGDSNDVAHRLERLLFDPGLTHRGEQARLRMIEKFGTETLVRKTEQLFVDVMAE